jgi:hypothetical protein
MSVSTLKTKIRYLLNETAKDTIDIFTYETSRVFSLSETNPIAISEVFKNDVEVSESGNWTYSSTTKKLTFESGYSLTSGDTIQINYTIYPNYSDTELDSYLQSALMYLSNYQYGYFEITSDDVNPEPTPEEENLIAMVSAIIIKPEDKSYRLPDMSVSISNRALPKEEKIQKLVSVFKKSKTGVYGLMNRDMLNTDYIV